MIHESSATGLAGGFSIAGIPLRLRCVHDLRQHSVRLTQKASRICIPMTWLLPLLSIV